MASAFSPGSVGNVGVGFDILGHAIAGIGDIAHVRPTERGFDFLSDLQALFLAN